MRLSFLYVLWLLTVMAMAFLGVVSAPPLNLGFFVIMTIVCIFGGAHIADRAEWTEG